MNISKHIANQLLKRKASSTTIPGYNLVEFNKLISPKYNTWDKDGYDYIINYIDENNENQHSNLKVTPEFKDVIHSEPSQTRSMGEHPDMVDVIYNEIVDITIIDMKYNEDISSKIPTEYKEEIINHLNS